MPSERSPRGAGYSGTESTERGVLVPTRGTRCCARKERRPPSPTSVTSLPCKGKDALRGRRTRGCTPPRPAPGPGGREHTHAACPPSAASRASSLQLARGRPGTRAQPAGRTAPARHAPPPPPGPRGAAPDPHLLHGSRARHPGLPHGVARLPAQHRKLLSVHLHLERVEVGPRSAALRPPRRPGSPHERSRWPGLAHFTLPAPSHTVPAAGRSAAGNMGRPGAPPRPRRAIAKEPP